MSKTPINQHKHLAEYGDAGQECNDSAPEPRKTDFDGPSGNRNDSPHGEEKSGD